MTVKQIYDVGDTVWIYGINIKNTLTEGTVVHSFKIDNYVDVQYVIAIPTGIEDLLEIRTWHNISQDAEGPSGALRTLGTNLDNTKRFLKKSGLDVAGSTNGEYAIDEADEDDISPEKIRAALEKSTQAVSHNPLVIKEPKIQRRRPIRKKKRDG